jgi:hypothetical protein
MVMMAVQQLDRELSSDLTLKQLISLARAVKETQTLSSEQQKTLLQRISRRIWQRSVAEYDGY